MADDQQKTSVEVGQPLSISLESMPASTGYSWVLASLAGGGVVLSDYDVQQHLSGMYGHVAQVFTFLGAREASAEIEFQLVRPWLPGTPGRTVKYTVTVTPPTNGDDIKATLGQHNLSVSTGAADCSGRCQPVALYAVYPPFIGGPQMPKYGMPPVQPGLLKYGIPPTLKYGYPPMNARYAAPQQFQAGAMMQPYGYPAEGCC